MLLELIVASTSGPANLDFEATLQHFLRFLRFPENRIEDDSEVMFDLLKALKNGSKSHRSALQSVKKNIIAKTNDFSSFFS